MTVAVRRATGADQTRALEMARDFHKASETELPFSAAMAAGVFNASLSSYDRICLVLDVDGTARGILVAHAGMHGFSPVKIATEIVWWIDPDARGRGAIKMLAAYEDWARACGCKFASMVGLGSDPAVSRLYESRNFKAAERHF
ncbi:GNAT family N-acetyltransferase, partial [Mesorhizobium sp. BR1-1-7]|uniref:GNAT family N-acetyltransferase n=1 Tax=Mesorhizobium sp. BR1-1-7 TaxID=2876647 RepID=UPI001CCB36C0